MTFSSPPARRLALVAGLFVAVLISCGREVTGPTAGPRNALGRLAAVAFDPQYETALKSSALHAALAQVAFERVRITLRREDGSIALDTVVTFPVGADSLTLSLNVLLPPSAPATGVPFTLNLGYVTAAGDTVFKGGPTPVIVVPSSPNGSPPPPVQIGVRYTGTGSDAASVVISPRTLNGVAGQSASFSAQALGVLGLPIAGTPVVFASSDAGVVRFSSPSSGVADLVGRGTAKVYAQLLTGQMDSATVTVILPAARIELTSGSAQTAPAGTALPQPVVARVLAADGIGVAGVTVTFAATSGAGSVSPASALTAADGSVSTTWTLGGTAGAQTMTVAASGLTGSPLTVSATALPVVASKLTVITNPASSKAGAPLGAVVAAQDALGNTVTTFAGDVSVEIAANPGSATLGGTATVKAVHGIATFTGLTLNRPGTGYTLSFSAPNLTSATSAAFNIVAGDVAKLAFTQMPASIDVGIAIAPPVQVLAEDASGNTVTSFTGSVTVAIGTNPGGSTLSGTLTRSAAAGVATFGDLSLNKKGSSYTLVASSSGLTGATSAAFNAMPGVPAAISVVSGAGQTAAAGATLAPIVLQVHDAYGNGLEGVTVTLAVATGGGSLGASSLVTDANGKVTVSWTLGRAGGSQSMTASVAGAPTATVAATATGSAGITYSWVGRAGALWSSASSWSPAGVPGPNDDVNIGIEVTATLTGNTSVHNVTLRVGELAVGPYDLTVSGNLTGDSYSFMSGTGRLRFTGSGAHTLTLPSATALSIDTGAVVTMGGSMYVAGDVDIGGRLAPNGNWLTVEGSLNVLAKGGLKMTLAADSVDTWDASFGGVASDTLLMDGFLAIENNFSQWGSSRSFAPTGAHVTALWAETYTGGPVLRASRAAQGGRASRASRTRPLGVNSRLRSATETAVPAARRRSMVANYISFANPGYAASHFNILEINPSYDIAIGSDLYATSTRRVGTASAAIFSTGAQHRLFQRGASLNDLVFGGVGLQIDVGGTLGEFKGITFTGQDTTADQLILSRNGGAVTLEWVTFATKPGSTGHYVKLVDGPSPFTVTFNTVSPAFHGGKVAIVGSSSFTNWPANPPSFTWLGSNTDWQNTANWSTGAVPGATDDVSIPASALNFPVFGYPAVTADVHHLTIESGASITLGCYGVVNVHGNLVGPTGTASIPGTPCEGNALNLKGDGSPFNTVVGNFGMLYVYGNYKISGPGSQLVVNSEIQIDGSLGAANLTVNGGRLDVGGVGGASYGALITRVGGTLTMTNPADQVFIGSDGAYFYGGSSTGRLTTGRLVINGGTLKVLSEAGSAADAFAPSGTHKTVFSGTSNAVFFDTLTTVFFQDVDLESGSSLNVETNATIRGTLAHGTGTGGVSILSPGSSTLTVAGLTQSGASTPMTISDVALKFVDGTSNATFSNVAFTGYASFAGALFEVARTSGGPYSFSALDFSAAALPDTNRVYLKNSGSQAVVMLMANPTTGISGTHWINIGGGTVSWP